MKQTILDTDRAVLDAGRVRAGATITPRYGPLLRRNMGSLT